MDTITIGSVILLCLFLFYRAVVNSAPQILIWSLKKKLQLFENSFQETSRSVTSTKKIIDILSQITEHSVKNIPYLVFAEITFPSPAPPIILDAVEVDR